LTCFCQPRYYPDRGDLEQGRCNAIATETGVRAASFTGIGAIDRLTLGFYDLVGQKYERRSFDEDMEVASMSGNLAVVDGGPFPHVHGVFCRRDFSAVGGHVFEAVVSIAVEVGVLTDPEMIRRSPADFCDLKLIDL
jgi:predicted DNA-binding protein with PD1-like motif